MKQRKWTDRGLFGWPFLILTTPIIYGGRAYKRWLDIKQGRK